MSTVRETWARRFDFLIACVGFSVGLGNIWRFPYLCFKNGGGAFLIPYFICAILGGIPLFYLEVSIGQLMGNAGFKAWRICPLFQGMGITTTVIMFFSNTFFNVVMAWAIYYLVNSFQAELPWANCGHEWNRFCRDSMNFNVNTTLSTNSSGMIEYSEGDSNYTSNMTTYVTQGYFDPVEEFWENKVLGISDGIDQPGNVKWDITLCLLAAWVVVYCCICKGIKTSGKVMYVTATSPYLFMMILLIRNCMLDGAIDGIIYYIKPQPSKLLDTSVWVDASSQILFSYSIGCNSLVAIGSYNKKGHNSYRDSILFAATNTVTSLLAGLVIFSILGHMALLHNTTVDQVVKSGPGLAFLAYPKAVTRMPLAPLWSALFFVMVLFLGLDSQFMGVEGVITAVVDNWPEVLRKGYRREIFAAGLCISNFLLGLSMVTNGGIYVFELFNYYSTCLTILLIAFLECVVIAWLYGVRRFYSNIQKMIGQRVTPLFPIMWAIFTPIFYLVTFLLSLMTYSELQYKRTSSVYQYPSWAIGIGWTMSAFSVMFIPLTLVYKLCKHGFTRKAVKYLLQPQGIPEFPTKDDVTQNGFSVSEHEKEQMMTEFS